MKSNDSGTLSHQEIAKLLAEIAAARDTYINAAQKASFAKNEETDALNVLNNLQSRFDDNIEKWKDDLAPGDSDWARKRRAL